MFEKSYTPNDHCHCEGWICSDRLLDSSALIVFSTRDASSKVACWVWREGQRSVGPGEKKKSRSTELLCTEGEETGERKRMGICTFPRKREVMSPSKSQDLRLHTVGISRGREWRSTFLTTLPTHALQKVYKHLTSPFSLPFALLYIISFDGVDCKIPISLL